MDEAGEAMVPSLLRGRRVAIIGAGLAGLTLARLLQMQNADVTVFERDASRMIRGQGGSLDLHEDSGQLALRRAGLADRFQLLARSEGQESRIYDRHGVLRATLLADDEHETRPEIDRSDLRDLLLDALRPGTVTWDRELLGVDRLAGGVKRLVFADAPAVEADLLCGCDGGWSKVRLMRTGIGPSYSGVTLIQTWISTADHRCPEIARFVGPGNVMALGDNKALMAQRNGNGHIRIYAALRVPEAWHREHRIAEINPEDVRDDLLRLFNGWADRLLDLLRSSDPVFQPWPLFNVPPRQFWRPESDVTLLGDAAHIMPPFTGRGANHAMLDAAELAGRLVSGRFATISEALANYETSMLARMETAIEETLASQNLMIAPDAPEGIAQHVLRRTEG